MSNISSPLKAFSRPTWRRILITFAAFSIPVLAFAKLADEVRESDTLPFDEAILRYIHGFATPDLDVLVVILTQFGGPVGVLALTIGATALLWIRQKHGKAAMLMSGVGGAAVLNLLIKSLFQRDRPQLWERLVTENSYSFPSGHAMASSALAFSLIVIFWPTRWRWIVTVLASLYMVVIAVTRIYLGVHYPSDVLAGWLVSAGWIAVLVIAVRYRRLLGPLISKK